MAAYKFRNDKGLVQKVELMLNNEERSDTVFLVNNARYHALSHLVAMYSTVLEALMNEYFAHCEDREIKIRNVKHEESFYLVLQYMYGVQMNFTETNINVICEALSLAERFEMADFSKELKQFVSTKTDGFDIETVVNLLNTSRKYNLNDLYKKVTEYAFKNTEQLVKHASFIQLQYEVLVDLLKSDWFFAKEIEILTGVLTWHDDMDVKRGKINADENIGQDIDEQDGDGVSQSTAGEQNLGKPTDTLSVNNETHPDIISGAGNSAEPSGETLDGNNSDSANSTSSGAKDLTNLVQSFKENVLKSLLSHIRAVGITAVDHVNAFKTDLFIKYKDILADYKYFSQSTQPRKQFVSPTSSTPAIVALKPELAQPLPVSLNTLKLFPAALHNKFYSISKVFTIKRLALNTVYESEEELQMGCFKLKMNLKETSPLTQDIAYFDIDLSFTSVEEGNWECYTEAQVIWKPICNATYGKCPEGCKQTDCSCKTYNYWRYLPSKQSIHKNAFIQCIFTSQKNLISMGQFNHDVRYSYPTFVDNNTIRLHVNIGKFHYKKMEN